MLTRLTARRLLCLALAGCVILGLLGWTSLASADRGHGKTSATHRAAAKKKAAKRHAAAKKRRAAAKRKKHRAAKRVTRTFTTEHRGAEPAPSSPSTTSTPSQTVGAPQAPAAAGTGTPFQVSAAGGQPAVAGSLVVFRTGDGGIAARLGGGATRVLAASGSDPDVAYDAADGEYLVVWSDATVHAQRLDAAGAPIGAEHAISTPDAMYRDKTPAVAWNPTGDQYLVTWAHTYVEFPTIAVKAQRLDHTGAEIGADDMGIASSEYRAPSDIATDPATGRWFAVWESNAEGPFSFVHGAFVSSDGALGARVEVSLRESDASTPYPGGFGYADDPAVAFDGHEFLVAWSDPNNHGTQDSSGPRSILGQHVSAAGELTGADRFEIAGGGAVRPAVAYDAAAGRFVTVWEGAGGIGGRPAVDGALAAWEADGGVYAGPAAP